jgi:hypothetical protein
MKSPGELGKVVSQSGDDEVLMVDDEHAVMDRDFGLGLSERERVEPDLTDELVPGREEGFAERGASRNRGGRSSDDDAGRSHPHRAHQAPCRILAAEIPRSNEWSVPAIGRFSPAIATLEAFGRRAAAREVGRNGSTPSVPSGGEGTPSVPSGGEAATVLPRAFLREGMRVRG